MARSYREDKPLASVSEVDLEQVAALAEGDSPLDLLLKQGARLLLEAALEQEIVEALGRLPYERRDEGQAGYRNGKRTRKLTSGVGELEVEVPRVRGLEQPLVSQVLPQRVRITEQVKELLPGLYIEGLSCRDFRRALGPSLGEAGLSKSAVSATCREVKERFAAWRLRSLASEEVVYLYLDGFYLGLRAGSKEKEGVLVAHGIRADGSRVLLGVVLGYRESTASWKGFLDDLVSRGLRPPKLVVCDGNAGLLRAVGETWPLAGVQRCIAHRLRNVLAKVPKKLQEAVKRELRCIFYAANEAEARQMARRFAEKWGAELPSAVRCLMSCLDSCLTFYRFPEEHWKRLRTSNILERAFKEVRRRTNVAGRYPTEEAGLSMVWAVLMDSAGGWRGVQMAGPTLRLVEQAAAKLPKSMWAINAQEERLAA